MHNVITLLRNEKIYQEADIISFENEQLYTGIGTNEIIPKYRHRITQDRRKFIAELDKAIHILMALSEQGVL